jgi:uncharacterized protein YecE (DUF72 family)
MEVVLWAGQNERGHALNPKTDSSILIGCAGWSIPACHAQHFPETGSHLERYAARFSCVEINSSFYRPHRRQTYEKWAASVPGHFRFAAKVPRSITHEHRLKDVDELLKRFLGEVTELGGKLGPLLVQLPPSLMYDVDVAGVFFAALRNSHKGQVVCEPRHPSWFSPQAGDLLVRFEVARVAADPALASQAGEPGGWPGLIYYRLHGSPAIYRSAYSPEFLDDLAARIRARGSQSVPVWCVFDNTAEGKATANAFELEERLR